MSHLEFGSCLLDFHLLKVRYENLRKLEDVDEMKYRGFPHVPPQVRFVQYYTVCHGYPKKPKVPPAEETKETSQEPAGALPEASSTLALPAATDTTDSTLTVDDPRSSSSTPRISIEDHSDREDIRKLVDSVHHVDLNGPDPDVVSELSDYDSELEMLEPTPLSEDENPAQSRPVKSGSQKLEDESTPSTSTLVPETPKSPDSGTSPTVQGPPEAVVAGPRETDSVRTGKFIEDFSETGDDLASNQPSRSGTVSTTATTMSPVTASEELAVLNAELPPVPSLPEAPVWPDLDKYTDKDARKQAEKEAKRVQKSYEQAIKNRDRAIRERNKIIEKRRRKRAQEAERADREEAKQLQRQESLKTAATAAILEEQKALSDAAAAAATPSAQAGALNLASPVPNTDSLLSAGASSQLTPIRTVDNETPTPAAAKEEKPPKPKKDRKFCTLPSKVNGQIDPRWVKIFMHDMDEVAAHTALFFPGGHYEKLVGDVGDLITGWVQEDATKRMILSMEDD
jgi:hypothetical protein